MEGRASRWGAYCVGKELEPVARVLVLYNNHKSRGICSSIPDVADPEVNLPIKLQ